MRGGWRAKLLFTSIFLSGVVTALAAQPNSPSLAWIGLIPLLLAIRSLTSKASSLAGVLWGVGFYLSAVVWVAPQLAVQPWALLLLLVVPGTYAGLGALLTRKIGFCPFILAVGWILVELGLQPLGLHSGLLAAAPVESPFFQTLGGLLGYAYVAFFVVLVNASIIVILSKARLQLPMLAAWFIAPLKLTAILFPQNNSVLIRPRGLLFCSRAPPVCA
ncbi:MAG: hypothetical protein V3T77_11395 [Planctomycetota bacterium]